MRTWRFVIPSLISWLAVAGAARAEPSIVWHFVPAEGDARAILQTELRCEDLNPIGNADVDQYAYIILRGAPDVKVVQLGIGYDHDVTVYGWIAITPAIQLPHNSWPGNHSGNAIAFRECVRPQGPDHLLVLGALQIRAGSWGRIWIEEYAYDNPAYVDDCGNTHRTYLEYGEPVSFARVHGWKAATGCDR